MKSYIPPHSDPTMSMKLMYDKGGISNQWEEKGY